MKNIPIAMVLLFFTLTSFAQNLVPNPSFEDTVACPVNGRLYNCQHWMNFGKTPDYNHTCAPGGNAFGVPYNLFGYQQAASGNAYADVCTFTSNVPQFREFIGVELGQQMVVGHEYSVSFKCCPGNVENGYCMQTNKLGIRFSGVPFDSASGPPINNYAHVYTNNIVTDTAIWTTVSGSFIADSAYTFLMLGNFFDDANTDTIMTCTHFAVYFIDDVSVVDLTVSLEEQNLMNSIKYYLVNDKIEFQSYYFKIEGIELFDSLGRLVKSNPISNENNGAIDIGGIPSGVYFALISFHGKRVLIKCFVNSKF